MINKAGFMKQKWTGCLVAACMILCSSSLFAGKWTTYDGQSVEADVINFDFATKMVTVEDPETQARTDYNTKDLDFSSRRQLLFSPVFHQSFPATGLIWPREKMWLFGLAIVSPILLLIIGMWVAGVFIARRFNPFSAVGAFLGSWIAGVILMVCYLVFAQKGGGTSIIYIGGLVGTMVMALFISAMYRTSFLKGVLIFIFHLLFAGFFAFVLIYKMEKFVPPDQVSAFWDSWVFIPTGLMDGAPRAGY